MTWANNYRVYTNSTAEPDTTLSAPHFVNALHCEPWDGSGVTHMDNFSAPLIDTSVQFPYNCFYP